MDDLIRHTQQINQQLARYGVKFGIYKNGEFHERLFPFDPIPRIIEVGEWDGLRRGLAQRVRALNCFLRDIYGEKKILADGIVPEDFVYRSPGYLPPCEGLVPARGVYSHISGIDLVKGKDGTWYVLEDNLRIPSGASYPLIARGLCRRCSPETFRHNHIVDNRNYGALLRRTMDSVNTGGINVVFTPGRYNAAYFEHSYLAEKSGAVLAEAGDLYVRDSALYYRSTHGDERVGAIYRRVSDEYMDPLCFEPSSLIGIPNLMAAYRAGNVAVLNAFGNGVADDKGIYYFVPKMIRYYDGVYGTPEEVKIPFNDRVHFFGDGVYGYRRITTELHNRGFSMNHKTVQRLMKELGLVCRVRIKKYHSYKGEVGKIAPNLLNRNFYAEKPNQKWVTDVTEFSLFGQKMYLSPILDLHNGYLVSYTISDRPVLGMITSMLEKAFETILDGTGLILHSDQGWQYQHKKYQHMIRRKGIRQSMSRKGNCLDNAVMENFFGLLKSEFLYLQKFDSLEHFKQELVDYLDYYNNRRIKIKLKGLPPALHRQQALSVA